MRKHPDILPPAPTLSNPVVRKAVFEVRRHVIAYLKQHGRKPDQIVIEFARETTKSAKVSDAILNQNRTRERERKKIQEDILPLAFGERLSYLSHNQLRAAVDRVILCRQQRNTCPYSGNSIDPIAAAVGDGFQVDHIIPYSRCGDNSLNNRVLCCHKANQDKGNKTPREWWGDAFNNRITPMRFMEQDVPAKGDYFTKRDYAHKWKNLNRENVPAEWKGSQLTDTAYAAVEVQKYLQESLWPSEPSHLAGGTRRIYVTKGIYTSTLRKEWQLYNRLLDRGATQEEVQRASAKNRGDHREHAVDAAVIACTDLVLQQEMARRLRVFDEERAKARAQGRDARALKRKPLPPPWGDVQTFRRQVLSQVYAAIDPLDGNDGDSVPFNPIIVSHRAIGRRLIGNFHEATQFGPVPGNDTQFVGRIPITKLKPDHLQDQRLETAKESVERLAKEFVESGVDGDLRKARKRANLIVESPDFVPWKRDPSPGKSGLVRDPELRRILREEIDRRLQQRKIGRDAGSFTDKDLKQILVDKDSGKPSPLKMPSGVPIKRVTLLRIMNDPVVMDRWYWDSQTEEWVVDKQPRARRAFVGGNNHHIEIRANAKGAWKGDVVPMYEAAKRLRSNGGDAIDGSEDAGRGGRFVMSLAQGETVFMCHKESGEPGYFVVVKLDKPQTVVFKHHWDARRNKGEKTDDGALIEESIRETFAVSASDLKSLAALGNATPIKVVVDALGGARPIEPISIGADTIDRIEPIVMDIARRALIAKMDQVAVASVGRNRPKAGSWKWMRQELASAGHPELAPQLASALRLLRNPETITAN